MVFVYSVGMLRAGQFLARRCGANGALGTGPAVTGFAIAAACMAGGTRLPIDKAGSG